MNFWRYLVSQNLTWGHFPHSFLCDNTWNCACHYKLGHKSSQNDNTQVQWEAWRRLLGSENLFCALELHSFFRDVFELLHNRTLPTSEAQTTNFLVVHMHSVVWDFRKAPATVACLHGVWNLSRETSKAEDEDQSPLKTGLAFGAQSTYPMYRLI